MEANHLKIVAALLAVAVLAGCVDMSTDQAPQQAQTQATPSDTFPGLDPGGKEEDTLHFKIQAYGSDHAVQVGKTAEDLYNRIMVDTNMYSFAPSNGVYSIVIYANQQEYLNKTRQPAWSGGVTLGNAIYSFDNQYLYITLAHEMLHVLWHEFMGSPRMDLRWLNEGLAVYEQNVEAAALGYQAGPTWDQRKQLREQPITFDQMESLVPATEQDNMVGLWYLQVGDVVRFMMDHGRGVAFSTFLAALKNNQDLDTAVHAGFPAAFQNMQDLEAQWRRTF